MPDATRLPEGILLTGTDVTAAAPLGTVKIQADGTPVESVNAAAAAYLTLAGLFPVQVTADPGTGLPIPVTHTTHIEITTGANPETNTLADPTFCGQMLSISCAVFGGGTRTITAATHFTQAPNNTIAFDAAHEYVLLMGVISTAGALRWELVLNDGTTLGHV